MTSGHGEGREMLLVEKEKEEIRGEKEEVRRGWNAECN